MVNEQKIRTGLFYASVLIFLIGLPFILSFALGYKFNRRTFKFTKAGLIVLRSQPQGASVYLNSKALNVKTPAIITELLPGDYYVELKLDKHYPWEEEIKVEAGKVTRLEKIILFPLRSHIKQLNKDRFSSFWIDDEIGSVYYVNNADNSIYKSDPDGQHYKRIAVFLWIPAPKKWKISPDGEKILYFNAHQIGITYLRPESRPSSANPPFILNYSGENIMDVFWHSDSFHLVLLTQGSIKAQEAQGNSLPVTLVKLGRRDNAAFYDIRNDTLYFLDLQKAADGNFYDNLYKLELNARTFPLQELMRRKND